MTQEGGRFQPVGEIVSQAELIDRVARDRAQGLTHAFANGVFDLLHVGHVRYLQAAAEQGDRLIVAINDDDSVRALKGPTRPILTAADRAELIAAVRGVDYVLIFSGSTVDPLLQVLQPAVHCKGTDYTRDTVPERETVRAYGGRIAIVGDPKDHSTRDLLGRIRAGQANLGETDERADGREPGTQDGDRHKPNAQSRRR
jgi:rfaE bifunctional protein nucleotidyltransferase chain/domain